MMGGQMMFRGVFTLMVVPLLALAADVSSRVQQRNQDYAESLEAHLRDFLVEEYTARSAPSWHRSYENVDAFLKSVEPNRERYRRFLSPPELKPIGPAERRPYDVPNDVKAEWLSIPLGKLRAEGLLAVPLQSTKPVPLIIAQHGIDSFPEKVFGQDDAGNLYHDYGHVLLREGFAVLAPFNLYTVEKRNRIERLTRLAGTTLPGIEFRRMQILLDEVLKDPRIDAGRVGFWGISLGGMAGMFWTPLEPRIQCAIITAWFNHRRNKMVIPDPRYSCFLETTEEHAFFNGWLTEFTDSDVASLICPRPLLIQHGKSDRIAHWPMVIEEFEAAQQHYQRLGLTTRIELDLHEGGHEIRLETGLPFLQKWLKISSNVPTGRQFNP
jgi:dienelactone hydrolase